MTVTSALTDPYPVSVDQRDQYRREGHIRLDGVAGPEVIDRYRPLIVETAMEFSRESRPMEERDTYGKALLQVTNLWQKNEVVAEFVLARRFAQIAADLLGVPTVRLYHDQALFKEPGGGPTPWHQDQFYWPIASDRTITLWMPLVDATTEMGTMRFASGSHQEGYLGDLAISDTSEAYFADFLSKKGYEIAEAGSMRAGDATFHSGWVLHGAPGNSSDAVREVMTIIYYDADALIAEPANDAQRVDLEVWFPGLKPGDHAASPINPMLNPD